MPSDELPRVGVNFDLCEGNGDCELAAPEVFHVGDADVVEVLNAHPGSDLREKVDAAIYVCPKAAISWARD